MKTNPINSQIENYTLIWIDHDGELSNPKNLYGMTLEKAKGSLIWTKKCLGKSFKAFIYDPDMFSIFNEDGSIYYELVEDLVICSKRLRDRKEFRAQLTKGRLTP